MTRRAHVPNTTLTPREVVSAIIVPLDIEDAERTIEQMLGVRAAVLFASARGAIAAAVGVLAPGQRVAVPAYTCVAVPNAVLSAESTPVYVDVDARGIVPADRWPESPALVAQDTYGFVAELPRDRVVVRDASHRADLLGTREALVAITSFEHSKSLSAGQGGLAVTDDMVIAGELRDRRDRQLPPVGRVGHGMVTLLTLLMGRLEYRGRLRAGREFRRVVLKLARDRLVGQSQAELHATGVDPRLLGRPNRTVARLVIMQLERAAAVAEHRTRIVAVYDRASGLARPPEPLVRYPMQVEDPARFEADLLAAGWDVRGRWFNAPLHPAAADPAQFGFDPGLAPQATNLAASVVNLPTHPLVSPGDAAALIGAALAARAWPLPSSQENGGDAQT